MSSRTIVGGLDQSSGSLRGGTQPLLPSNSLGQAGRAPLERGNALQTMLDCLAVLAAFLVVSLTGIGFAAALFVLLFVRL